MSSVTLFGDICVDLCHLSVSLSLSFSQTLPPHFFAPPYYVLLFCNILNSIMWPSFHLTNIKTYFYRVFSHMWDDFWNPFPTDGHLDFSFLNMALINIIINICVHMSLYFCQLISLGKNHRSRLSKKFLFKILLRIAKLFSRETGKPWVFSVC